MDYYVDESILEAMAEAALSSLIEQGVIFPREICNITAAADIPNQQIVITIVAPKSWRRKKPQTIVVKLNFDPEGGGPVAAA